MAYRGRFHATCRNWQTGETVTLEVAGQSVSDAALAAEDRLQDNDDDADDYEVIAVAAAEPAPGQPGCTGWLDHAAGTISHGTGPRPVHQAGSHHAPARQGSPGSASWPGQTR